MPPVDSFSCARGVWRQPSSSAFRLLAQASSNVSPKPPKLFPKRDSRPTYYSSSSLISASAFDPFRFEQGVMRLYFFGGGTIQG